eukprot:1186921-Prorocentrum_minimum.AAC.2
MEVGSCDAMVSLKRGFCCPNAPDLLKLEELAKLEKRYADEEAKENPGKDGEGGEGKGKDGEGGEGEEPEGLKGWLLYQRKSSVRLSLLQEEEMEEEEYEDDDHMSCSLMFPNVP